jgi:gamma-glutamyltranspeptidase / glutathione hydrolase
MVKERGKRKAERGKKNTLSLSEKRETKSEMSGSENTGGMRNFVSPTPSVFPPPESMRPTLVGSEYMLSAGHPLVAQVAANILEKGGTAIDAGVAAGLASNVIQPDMCNFGGVAPTLLRQGGSSQVWSISGVGYWGRKVTTKKFVERYGHDMPLGAAVGVVPAAPDVWLTALQRFGTMSFNDVAAPAIHYAEEGFPLDVRTATALEILGRGFSKWESSRRIYHPQGRPPKLGERIVQKDLANLLKTLANAEEGTDRANALDNVRRAFYEGDIAERIVSFNEKQGGWLTKEDLADFRCDVELAPHYSYHGYKVHTPTMVSQGPIILQTLSVLEHFDLPSLKHNSADYIHILVEAMKLAFSDRERFYCDSKFTKVKLEHLLSEQHVRSLQSMIQKDKALPDLATAHLETRARFDTTYFCVIDKYGNAFSSMPSDTLDGAPIVPGLGILTSPRGVQSRLDPNHPASLQAGKRPRLTPAPALALKGDEVMTFGCPGGDVIVQSMLQAFLNVVHFGMLPQQAVEVPRVATFAFPGSFFPNVHIPGLLNVEARISESIRHELTQRGHNVRVWPEYEFDVGGVSLVGDLQAPTKEGRVLAGAADPRRTNYAWGK